jgi:hypothetical protein
MTYTPLTEEQLDLHEAAAMDARDGMVDVIDDDLLSMLAEIRALRSDKARLDWLLLHCRVVVSCTRTFFKDAPMGRTADRATWQETHSFELSGDYAERIAAIDAAMKEGRG